MKHELLISRAIRAVDDLMQDTSVSLEKTLESLQEVADHIESNIDCLAVDLEEIANGWQGDEE